MSVIKVGAIQNQSGIEVYTAKAWINFNGAGTVASLSSGNVSSISDQGVGNYLLSYTNAFVDSNYAMSGMSVAYSSTNLSGASMVALNPTGTLTYVPIVKSTTQVNIIVGNPSSGANQDSGNISVNFLR